MTATLLQDRFSSTLGSARGTARPSDVCGRPDHEEGFLNWPKLRAALHAYADGLQDQAGVDVEWSQDECALTGDPDLDYETWWVFTADLTVNRKVRVTPYGVVTELPL